MRSLSNTLANIHKTAFGVLALIGLVANYANACSYSENNYYSGYYYTYKNYNVCDGSYCSANLYCDSYNCVNNVCTSKLAPWAIFLITFFSVFFFILFLRILIVCMRRKRTAAIVIQANHHSDRHTSDNSHHHHHHH